MEIHMKTQQTIATIVAEVGGGSPDDETLRGLDSLGLVELVVRLEEYLEVEIPDTSLNDSVFDSLENLTALVEGVRRDSPAGRA
jgi:acyl carrier protein